jgi:lipopolysaccharide biosynthesis protein
MKNSLCLYSSYFTAHSIPYYVRFYLEQLLPHVSKLVFINNDKQLTEESLSFLRTKGIEIMMVANEGYDFGMWSKGFTQYNAMNYQRVVLVNDSCVLFKDLADDFRRINSSDADYIGMVISDRYATHLQSFFLVINEKAISHVASYFNHHGLVSDYSQVIETYEIGLTQKLMELGLTVESLYNNAHRAYAKNPSFALVPELIDEGIPLLKKKILFRNYRGFEYLWVVRMNFETDYRKHIAQIKGKYPTGLIDFDRVMSEAPKQGHLDVRLLSTARTCVNTLRKIPGARWVFHRLLAVYKTAKELFAN